MAAGLYAAIGSTVCAAAPAGRPAGPGFEEQVAPILRAHCLDCHAEESAEAQLDLSTPEGLLRGGESGPVIVPGKPDESLLFERVHDGSMPAEGDPLSAEQVAAIRSWIESGCVIESLDASAVASVPWHEVQALMLLRCTVCHGARRREARLDLRTAESMIAGGKSGPALVPGEPDKSLLLARIHSGAMPPRDKLVEVSVKPMTPAEIDKLTRWIEAGAAAGPVASEPEAQATASDRQFWSFQPPQAVEPPAAADAGWARNPIDAFVAARRRQQSLEPAAEAPREVLLRRAYFDLTGLPPTAEEVEAFLNDTDPAAYEKLIDRLLGSPRYGERWGRHWLDVAGYADSEGKREQDLPRQFAWRYRDYVIRSFNTDKPYDRFLLEQIAGDELADYENAPRITQEIYDNLVATGFLRMAPDGTWANITGFVPDRLEVIADELDVLGSAVMGLSIKCARCHSHKFDPISQRDYYRLTAVFKGAFDEHDWLKPQISTLPAPLSADSQPGRLLPFVRSDEREAWLAQQAQLDGQIAELQERLAARETMLAQERQAARLAELPEALRDDLARMLATPAAQRDAVQAYLAEKFETSLRFDRQRLMEVDAEFKQLVETTEQGIARLSASRQPEPMIRALWDRGDPTPAFVYRRGDYLSPAAAVEPGVPWVLEDPQAPFQVQPPWPGAKQTGRRLAFARWLVRPNHPLTARVMVNRIWKHHFGEGLVRSLDNFGKTGDLPTHPELLDWLAVRFVNQGWSIKAMHRLMMTSSTYRQSSSVNDAQRLADPANRLLGRMPMTRMEAEVLADTLAAVAGMLDPSRYGPADPVTARGDGLVTATRSERGWRRAIYSQQWRKQLPTMLETFDLPQMNPNCVRRSESIVAPQALHLLNDASVRELADHFAQRVWDACGGDPTHCVQRVYLTALGRPATSDETALGVEALARLGEAWRRAAADGQPAEAAQRRALTSYCHMIINTAEFLYID